MAIILKSNTIEELRGEIVTYLEYIEDRERNAANAERTISNQKSRRARANLAQTLAMEINSAILQNS